jgi:hypothetical protein
MMFCGVYCWLADLSLDEYVTAAEKMTGMVKTFGSECHPICGSEG